MVLINLSKYMYIKSSFIIKIVIQQNTLSNDSKHNSDIPYLLCSIKSQKY